MQNAQQKIRMNKMGNMTKMQYFFSLLKNLGYQTWFRHMEGTNVLGDVMFAHPKAQELLTLYPYVLCMDCTYRTNKYDMPMLEIIGITSTGKNYHVAFAFLKNERKASFFWAMSQLRMMFYSAAAPDVIVTDRELALIGYCFLT